MMLVRIAFVVVVCCSVVVEAARNRFARDVNEFVLNSLQLHRVQLCDGERERLKCPQKSHIHIEDVFYGRIEPSSQLCPARPRNRKRHRNKKKNRRRNRDRKNKSDREKRRNRNREKRSFFMDETLAEPQWFNPRPLNTYEDLTCNVPTAQEVVSNRCNYKRRCGIRATPHPFGLDPCPTTSKYLQVTFRCRPSKFAAEHVCSGDTLRLTCPPDELLAFYSAKYGGVEEGRNLCQARRHRSRMFLADDAGADAESPADSSCTRVTDVVSVLVNRCQAKTDCALPVQRPTFGPPPCADSVLSIHYACVHRSVYSPDFVAAAARHSPDLNIAAPLHTTPPPNDAAAAESELPQESMSSDAVKKLPDPLEGMSLDSPAPEITTTPNSQVETATPLSCLPPNVPNAFGIIHDWIATYDYVEGHREKFLLYFCLSMALGLILLLCICIAQQCWRRCIAPPVPLPRASPYVDGPYYASSQQIRASKTVTTNSSEYPHYGVYGHFGPPLLDESHVEPGEVCVDGMFTRWNHPTPPHALNQTTGRTSVATTHAPTVNYYGTTAVIS